jgi:hypothetical protein
MPEGMEVSQSGGSSRVGSSEEGSKAGLLRSTAAVWACGADGAWGLVHLLLCAHARDS